jgi:hypothetical protein
VFSRNRFPFLATAGIFRRGFSGRRLNMTGVSLITDIVGVVKPFVGYV